MDLLGRKRATLVATVLAAVVPAGALAQNASSTDSESESGASGTASESAVGVGVGFYLENSRLDGEETRERQTTDQSYDYSADNLIDGELWYLTTVAPRLRAGGGLQYFGGYEAMPEPQEDQDEEDVEAFEFGQMLTPFARAEWLVPFLDEFQFVLGASAGLTLLFPDGDFRREIEDMKDQDISVFGGPRWGVDLGPDVGVRWQLDRRLALRADFAVHWQRVFLLDVDDSVEQVDFRRNWTLKVLRYNIGLGFEVGL